MADETWLPGDDFMAYNTVMNVDNGRIQANKGGTWANSDFDTVYWGYGNQNAGWYCWGQHSVYSATSTGFWTYPSDHSC